MIQLYWKQMVLATIQLMQYRVGFFFWVVGMAFEPVIYLVVWQAVARERGGEVAGYTVSAFAAYYITWTLVRQMNIGLTPWAFEGRILRGELSPQLLLPVHPFHLDLASFFGMKVVTTLVWFPVALLLYFVFRPEFNLEAWRVAAFLVCIVTGFVMRFILLWALGMITFWVQRVTAIFEVYFGLELVLSGRLVPLELLPGWAQRLADWLPYQWSFGFPIELLIGRLNQGQTVHGFIMQGVWAVIGLGVMLVLWRKGLKRYSAVGA